MARILESTAGCTHRAGGNGGDLAAPKHGVGGWSFNIVEIMFDIIYKIAVLSIILSYLIWRFLHSPKFTNFARHFFIVESLTNRSFEELKCNKSKRIKVKDRTGYAHWKSYEHRDGCGILVEFNVHPSAIPFSMSAAEFIHIRNDEHLEQIKKSLQQSNDYSPFLADDEDVRGAIASRASAHRRGRKQ